MDEGTGGNVGQGQGVAGLNIGGSAGGDDVAHGQALGRHDVALFAVFILQQGDVRAAVGIVLDGNHRAGHIELVALEVDDAPPR